MRAGQRPKVNQTRHHVSNAAHQRRQFQSRSVQNNNGEHSAKETASHTHKVQIEHSRPRSWRISRRWHIREIDKLALLERHTSKLNNLIATDHSNEIVLVSALAEFEGRRRHALMPRNDDSTDSKTLSMGVHVTVVANHENKSPNERSDHVLARNSPIVAKFRDTRKTDTPPTNRAQPNPRSGRGPMVFSKLPRRQTRSLRSHAEHELQTWTPQAEINSQIICTVNNQDAT